MTSIAMDHLAPIRAYAKRLRDLHQLSGEGKHNSDEAEAVRDEMDGPWDAMTEAERERMRWLSADLYDLEERKVVERPMTAEEKAAYQEQGKQALAAFDDGDDFDAALAFLRRPIPAGTPPAAVRFLQARIWARLGDLETALLFMRDAERLDPSHDVEVMQILARLGRVEEAVEHAERVGHRREKKMTELLASA